MSITGIFEKFKFSKFLQTHFTSPIPIRIKKKSAPPGVVCHGLQENALQVNQLYNVTWSSAQWASYVVGAVTIKIAWFF